MKKLLLLISEDWYFWSHRLNLARAAQKQGYAVTIAARQTSFKPKIEAEGFTFVPLKKFHRSSKNILKDLASLFELYRVYRSVKPDIVHHVAWKPVLYGSLIAWATRIPRVINALGGLGYLFTVQNWKTKLVRCLLLPFFRTFTTRSNVHFILQNQEDIDVLSRANFVDEDRVTLIPGAGVDVTHFSPHPEPEMPIVISCVSRLLVNKGINEFVDAARILKAKYADLRVQLCGEIDPDNPSALSQQQIEQWVLEGVIEYLGHVDDVNTHYKSVHIAVLPSYREGFPKSLLEAAACGKPIVATDVPGCRDAVSAGKSGLLVPPRDAAALATALDTLIRDKEMRQRMGETGRQRVMEKFADEVILPQVLGVYGQG